MGWIRSAVEGPMAMEFGVPWPLGVVRDGVPVPLFSADTLIDLIWHGKPPRPARASVHAYVMPLRKAVDIWGKFLVAFSKSG
jgi:DNA-binding SARP family transcriptional activator